MQIVSWLPRNICQILFSSAPPRSVTCISQSRASGCMRRVISQSFPAGLVASHSVTSKCGRPRNMDKETDSGIKWNRQEEGPRIEKEEIEKSGWRDKELRAVWWSHRPARVGHLLALKNTQRKWEGNGKQRDREEEAMGWGVCRWQAATRREEQGSRNALQGERPHLTPHQRYGSWQVEEGKEDGGGVPSEDESNNLDMTLPKANLALQSDDVPGFLHLTVLLCMETLM